MGLREKLEELRKQGIQEIKASADLEHLNDIRVKMLGKKGPLTTVLRGMSFRTRCWTTDSSTAPARR